MYLSFAIIFLLSVEYDERKVKKKEKEREKGKERGRPSNALKEFSICGNASKRHPANLLLRYRTSNYSRWGWYVPQSRRTVDS